MSTAELKRIVDDASPEEQQFLLVCLSEKLNTHRPAALTELDRRSADLEAGNRRMSLEEFERRLPGS